MSFENTAPMHDVRELREVANALRPSVQPDKPPFNSKTTAPMFPRDPALDAVLEAAVSAPPEAPRSNSAVVASMPAGTAGSADKMGGAGAMNASSESAGPNSAVVATIPMSPGASPDLVVSGVCTAAKPMAQTTAPATPSPAAPSMEAAVDTTSAAPSTQDAPAAASTPAAPATPSTQAMRAAPSAPESTPSTGARNSTSVLFSLKSLGDKQQATTRALQQTLGATDPDLGSGPVLDANDDSGVIDLHRLMPSGSKLSVQLVKPRTNSDPPLAVAVATDVQRKSTYPRRVALFALFGAVLAIGAIIGLRFVWKWAAQKEAMRMMAMQHASAPAAPAAAPPAAPAPPAPASEPIPTVDPLVPPPPAEAEINAANAATEATISKAMKSKSRKHRHHSRRSKAAQAPVPAPAPNDPCHCGSDLACAMRCASANGR
ncbi:hypothetical protein [Pendulispora albinea]|uniref:Uncharacterized protein n=1 Tax=Pendulispora albinea TaxID=2741071 RepID=A0ABZ2LSU8_9BACT